MSVAVARIRLRCPMLQPSNAVLMVLYSSIEGFVSLGECFGNGCLDVVELLVKAIFQFDHISPQSFL